MPLVLLAYFIEILDKSTFLAMNRSTLMAKSVISDLPHGKSDPPLWVGFQFDTLFVAMIRLIKKGVLKLKCYPNFTGFSSSLDFLKMQVSGQYI